MATFIHLFAPAPAGTGTARRLAVKDLIDMAGVVTTNGSKVVAAGAAPAEADAACMAGTRAAEDKGTVVVVGKTNLHELAFGVTGINPWYGTPVNPLDPSRVPGGSSSGSAVAVATGEADLAFGSDTGGSIRVPAACCGVVGLKTTRGRVPLGGVRPLAPSLDTVGPMAASVRACEETMALLEPGFDASRVSAARSVGRLRLPAAGWVDRALDEALSAWAATTGAGVVDVELPGWEAATSAVMTILSAEAWGVHEKLWRDHGADLADDVSRRLEMASLVHPDEVAEAWEVGRSWARELASLLGEIDVLALPVLADAAPTLEDAGMLTSIRYVAPFNLSGTPALALPVPGGGVLPASLQLAGPAHSEELLLTTAAEIEAALGP